MAKEAVPDMAALEFALNERLFIVQALKLVPPWVFGFVIWFIITRVILARIFPRKILAFDLPFALNLFIVGLGGDALKAAGLSFEGEVDILGDLPPGVNLAALMDVVLTSHGGALDLLAEGGEFLDDLVARGQAGADSIENTFYRGVITVITSLGKALG